jgi:hypothetical protein
VTATIIKQPGISSPGLPRAQCGPDQSGQGLVLKKDLVAFMKSLTGPSLRVEIPRLPLN